MSDNILLNEIEKELGRYHKLYDAFRIIDPVNKRVINSDKNLNDCSKCNQLDSWKNDPTADNSIALRAYQENECIMKLEQTFDSTFLVTVFPIETPSGKLILELLKNVTSSLSIGSNGYSDPTNNLAMKDELTNLFNRRFADEHLSKDVVRAISEKSPLSVIFLDIDNLKEINDTLGHAFGDRVLLEVSDVILQSIRSQTDWVARYGGDEYVICLNDTDKTEAFEIAERIRNKIAELVILQNERIKTSASLGIFSTEQQEVTAAEVIALADSKMYDAKRKGKNCTMQ